MGRGCIFRIPARGGAQPFAAPSLPFFPAVAQCRSRARRRKRFLLQLQHSTQPASKARRMAAMGGFAVFRIQNCGAKPLCAAGQDGLRATAKKISCRLPAASGHFASQNRRTLFFQKWTPLRMQIFHSAETLSHSASAKALDKALSGRYACTLFGRSGSLLQTNKQ